MRRTIQLFFILLLPLNILAQNGPTYHPPVKIPMFLSGNFGEIRPNHFHSGIDIKTQGTTGHHIFSIAEGYVSRIKVQTGGYGKSVYVSHPDGTTSVYGHLSRYREDMASFVEEKQYQKQSQQLDLYLKPGEFSLKRGDFIAYSGNTGSSSGPHLHFEIRNTANQHPINGLKYDFDIRDDVAPRFRSIRIEPLSKEGHLNGKARAFSSPVVLDHGSYTIPYGTRVSAWGEVGISVEVFDYLNGSSNRCGVYTLEMYVDSILVYGHVMDEFSFGETRFVNAHMDYTQKLSSGISGHRLYRLPGDKLAIYNREVPNVPLQVNSPGDHSIRIVATDVAGNRSILAFTLKADGSRKTLHSSPEGFVKNMKYQQSNSFSNENIKVELPARALYRDLDFTFGNSAPAQGSLTPFYHISSITVPVHSPYTLSLKAPDTNPLFHDKLLLITYNKKGEIEALGGTYQDGFLVAKPRTFGKFAIAIDSIAPEIIPISGKINGDISQRKDIRFSVPDNLSGVEKYEGYIDNRWVLFEYDPRDDLLIYRFDEKRISRGRMHELELYLTDAMGNINLFHTTFIW